MQKKFTEYFGEEKRICNRKESIGILDEIIKEVQSKMKSRMEKTGAEILINQLQNMFSKIYQIYIEQKKVRANLKLKNIRDGAALEIYEINKQISKNLIDGISVWIENALLYQSFNTRENNQKEGFDIDLFIDVYIYGVVSMNFSLLHMSEFKQFGTQEFFCGLDITPQEDIPIQAFRDDLVIYHNPLITGNQSNLFSDEDFKNANSMEIGIQFKKKHGISFLSYMAVLYGLSEHNLKKYIKKDEFIKIIDDLGIKDVTGEIIYNEFLLTKENVITHLKSNDEYIWTVETNENRLSLKPFIQINSGNILTNRQLLDKSMHTWISYLLNGGSIYVKNPQDELLKAFQSRNERLGERLVELLRNTLRENYNSIFDEIEVPYTMIWGKKEINYGDFDLMFYSEEAKELFLIEAKYICDSLNAAGMVSDYDKMFRDKGYHFKCRRRYELVINESETLKKFISIDGEINVHFLFVTSKPLDIKLQDKDDIVTFISLETFESYISGKYESENWRIYCSSNI
ncbi:hypothetical protein C6X99_16995 [Bacillus pumilus]|nr:hypothetical protein C6X99_16995 [Bacillus pumilus]